MNIDDMILKMRRACLILCPRCRGGFHPIRLPSGHWEHGTDVMVWYEDDEAKEQTLPPEECSAWMFAEIIWQHGEDMKAAERTRKFLETMK